jgi:hypothetical protein
MFHESAYILGLALGKFCRIQVYCIQHGVKKDWIGGGGGKGEG